MRVTTWPELQHTLWTHAGGSDYAVARALKVHPNTPRWWRLGVALPVKKHVPLIAELTDVPIETIDEILVAERVRRYHAHLVTPAEPAPTPGMGALVQALREVQARPITPVTRERRRRGTGRSTKALLLATALLTASPGNASSPDLGAELRQSRGIMSRRRRVVKKTSACRPSDTQNAYTPLAG